MKCLKYVSSGIKRVEVRLYDEKRQWILPGQYIVFTNIQKNTEIVAVRVHSINIYRHFEELFRGEDLELCCLEKSMTAEQAANYMGKYYTVKEMELYCAVAFRIERIDLDYCFSLEKQYEEAKKEREYEKLFPDGMK